MDRRDYKRKRHIKERALGTEPRQGNVYEPGRARKTAFRK